jgi:predicted 3-demethylubiquinone-9 3-methyltransferase (glyoxalase superfamily)
MPTIQKLNPCLWFDGQAEDAAKFYTEIFDNSKIVATSRYTEAGQEIHKRAPGSVMTVDFVLDGHPFVALNGGPDFKFSEAISFQVPCETQDEIAITGNAYPPEGRSRNVAGSRTGSACPGRYSRPRYRICSAIRIQPRQHGPCARC